MILRICNKRRRKNIYVNEDLCYEDRQERNILVRHLKTARNKGYFI